MTPERLQKILARVGFGSRRHVEEMIQQGRVTVDGRVAELGERADFEAQAVKVDGKRVTPSTGPRHYLLLHKPSGYMSTVNDPEGRATVLDLLPIRLRKGMVPVGRLDYATEGLLLLTNDGDFAHHVAHPRYGCRKTYEVKVKGHPSPEAINRLRHGVVLDGKRTAPADIRPRKGHLGPRESQENSWWVVILGEGRTRQVREMFQRVGHPVSRLRRVAIGPVSDPYLPRGAYRELSEAEVETLRKKTARKKKRPTAPPRIKPPKKKVGSSKGAVSQGGGSSKSSGPSKPSGPSKAGPHKAGPHKAGGPSKGSGPGKSGPAKRGTGKASSSRRGEAGKPGRGRGSAKTGSSRPGSPRSGSSKTSSSKTSRRRPPRHD